MTIHQLFEASSSTYSYLVVDDDSHKAILIDPVRETFERDLGLIDELSLELIYVLDTHVHADHVTAAGDIRARTGAQVVGSPKGASCVDLKVQHGDVLRFGNQELRVLETPGHTDDSLSFVIADNVFTGDALLVRKTGRTDFQNGDAGQLYDSITKRLFALPDATRVWPGHDYAGFTSSSIGTERRLNRRVANRSRNEFIELRGALDLARPAKIDIAVPANQQCGRIGSQHLS